LNHQDETGAPLLVRFDSLWQFTWVTYLDGY
jgi:hypothetical protein